MKKTYYLFILISITIIIIFTGCENKDAETIGEDTTEDIADEIELIEDTEDGINRSCDFEIINHKEIILNCYSVPLEAEYYCDNGDLYIDGKKFIRQ